MLGQSHWQCPVLAPSVHGLQMVCVASDTQNAGTESLAVSSFSPVGSRSSNVCVCGRNELEVCTTLTYPHIHISSFLTMGLKVDVAESLPFPCRF